MVPNPITKEQFNIILENEGHGPCPGVEIKYNCPIASVPGGPELYATIYSPTSRPSKPTPALLAFHGGGWVSGHPDDSGSMAKTLALSLGITTISPSYRLATEGKSIYPGLLDDGLLAYRWVQANAQELCIDPSRIIVSGASAGVFQSTHLAVNSPAINLGVDEPRPAALIAQWGPIDFVARWFDRNENPGSERDMLGTSYEKDPALYHQSNPITYASGALPPALFIYGRQDPIVHARQGRLGHAAWKAAGAHSELQILGNVGHCTEGDNRDQCIGFLRTTIDFLAARLTF
jgi:acetyl esterase/lipase